MLAFDAVTVQTVFLKIVLEVDHFTIRVDITIELAEVLVWVHDNARAVAETNSNGAVAHKVAEVAVVEAAFCDEVFRYYERLFER